MLSWNTLAQSCKRRKLVRKQTDEDSSQVARENELLKNIVVRERHEETPLRDLSAETGAGAERQISVRSDFLNKQIEFSFNQGTKLSSEELALFSDNP